MRALFAATLMAISPITTAAQQMAANPAAPITPPGWAWRMDAPAEPQRGGTGNTGTAKFEFTPMAPGWHITMGPGGVLYAATSRAEGRFVLEGEMIYFADGARSAEWGVAVGGNGLDGNAASWLAFVVRDDGKAAVLRHQNGQTTPVMDWTAHDAIRSRDSTGFTRNRVAVRAEPDSVRLVVNATVIRAWPRTELDVNGHYGFRIGKQANLHITNLDLTQRLAPFPARR